MSDSFAKSATFDKLPAKRAVIYVPEFFDVPLRFIPVKCVALTLLCCPERGIAGVAEGTSDEAHLTHFFIGAASFSFFLKQTFPTCPFHIHRQSMCFHPREIVLHFLGL